jgi:uncharacterized protein (TIRG00374 family)
MEPTQSESVDESDLELATEVVSKPVKRPVAGRVVVRVIGLAITAFGLYVIWPTIVQTFSALPRLQTVNPWLFPVALAAETASFVCFWILLELCLHSNDWFVIATSQLASNTASRIVPGGAATGGALQLRMLVVGGVDTPRATTGLAAASLLTTAVLFGMPVLAIPAFLSGVAISEGLQIAALMGLGVFAFMIVAGVAVMVSDKPLELTGTVVERITAAVKRRPRANELPGRLLKERDLVRRTLGEQRWLALGTAIGKSVFEYLALLVALLAVGADPRPSLVVLAYAASAVLAMIPITPGGLGFVEAGLTAMLTLAGVGAADAVLATLAFRMVSYWLPLPIGAVALVMFRRRFGHV